MLEDNQSQGDHSYECPSQECHNRVERIDRILSGKVSWRMLIVMSMITSATISFFIDNKLCAIENSTIAIAILEERTSNIKKIVKEGVREAYKEILKEGKMGR